MADDNNARYRTSNPFAREPLSSGSTSAGANDPLAELARLIGKNDLFSDLGRDRRTPAEHDNSLPHENNLPHADDAPHYGAAYRPRHDDPPMGDWQRDPDPTPDRSYSDPSYPDDLPPSRAESAEPEPMSLPPLPRMLRPDPSFSDNARRDEPALPPHDEHRLDLPRFDPLGYSSNQDRHDRYAEAAPPIYPHEQEDDLPPADDDAYYSDHEPPRGRERRKGMLTVAAVLALAVVGTAGAFGYRSIVRGASSASPPPVIRASGEPNKVAPPASPTTTASADQGKFSYDRFGDRGKNEQVVAREEKPVDPQELARSTVPRTVFPGVPNPSARPGATTVWPNPPGVVGEPRRVRTVPIRPDQADMAANMPSEMPQPAPVREASVAPSGPANAAPAESPPLPAAAPRPAAPRTTSRAAAHSAPAPAARSVGAPLSLSPNAASQLPPANATPRAQASQAQAPERVASLPPAARGGYLVQVSSQRSEADAQASYRSIQSRYSSVLGGHPHVIRKATLGSKGTYYRAMVGPFGSREEAVRLCASLKQAGGDCVVQH
jgi:hypothetical protein